MQVLCEKCDAVIPAKNLDLSRNLAQCPTCGEVFNCADQLDSVADVPKAVEARGEVSLPKGMHLFRRKNGLRITRRWWGMASIGLVFFSLLWNGFMCVWFGIAIREKQWVMGAFGSIHLLVGLGVGYATLCHILNTTTITVMNNLLSIKHAPLPAFGAKEIRTDEINQLYTKRCIHHTKNGTHTTYELRYQTVGGEDKKLLKFDKQEQALFVEQQTEEFLNIADKSVAGEVAR